jgi:hypothetical protein
VKLTLILILFVLLSFAGLASAQDAVPSEYQIKSAFLFNFARFIEWPPKAFTNKSSPLIIGVLGNGSVQEDLAKTVRDKKIEDHPLVMRALQTTSDATNCHIVFISNSEHARGPQLLEALKGLSVLTVGEMDRFTESGGMINFVKLGTRVRFQINNDAATSAALKISSKLLSLNLRSSG